MLETSGELIHVLPLVQQAVSLTRLLSSFEEVCGHVHRESKYMEPSQVEAAIPKGERLE